MGGKVLELESDRLIQKGLELGRTQGLEQGISQGLAQSVSALLRKGKTVEEIADLLDLSLDYVQKIKKEL